MRKKQKKDIDWFRVAGMVGSGIGYLRSKKQDAAMRNLPPPDPMEGMANAQELETFKNKENTFYLGHIHDDHGVNFEAGISDDRHIFIQAGTRSGKGTSLLIQNCLRWQGPILCIDPKGEAASITAMRRGTAEAAKGTGTSVRNFIGQKVAILDPLDEVKGPARAYVVGYNPLQDINMDKGGGVRQINAIASGLIVSEQGEASHFSESAETILAGVIEMVKKTVKPHDQTLPAVRRCIQMDYVDLTTRLSRCKTKAGLATEALSIMEQVGINEWGSFRSTLSRGLKWMAEPDMQDHLNPKNNFSLWKAMQEGWSIYVVLPPDQIADFKSWLRVIVRFALSAKMSLGTNQKGPQTLFLLDEFPALGHFKIIESAAAQMAGYGIKLAPIIQNIGQIKDLYKANWETFLANAGAIISWGLNDGESEKYISERLGRVIVLETSHGTTSGLNGGLSGSAGNSATVAPKERPVRFPNEIHEQGSRETMRAFVIPASGKGFTIRRTDYMDIKTKGLFDSPDFITEWEKKYGRGNTGEK